MAALDESEVAYPGASVEQPITRLPHEVAGDVLCEKTQRLPFSNHSILFKDERE